jgi:catechol 2,3-dioxygenase-like lactoylglutathione lyase family enzyme
MPISQVKEIALYVKDLEKSKEFYHHLLGFDIIGEVKDRHIFFRVGSSVLLCFNPEATRQDTILPPHFAYGHQHIAFEVPQEEYESWKIKITALEIQIVHEHDWGKGFQSFYFKDVDDHVLEIVPAGMWGY